LSRLASEGVLEFGHVRFHIVDAIAWKRVRIGRNPRSGLREQAVLFYTQFGDLLRVLIGDAFAALLVSFGIGFSPPVMQIALGIELAALVIEAVRYF
jgi:hypothetical protein